MIIVKLFLQSLFSHMPLIKGNLLNRDISWLHFNHRVLEEAMNEKHPLLERVRYLSINANNLDEFTTTRVANLETLAGDLNQWRSDDGMTHSDLLAQINGQVRDMLYEQQTCWLQLKKELAEHAIEIVDNNQLGETDLLWLEKYFVDNVYPILTPVAISSANPFPFIPNLGVALILKLEHKETGDELHAILPIPTQLERFIKLPMAEAVIENAQRFIRSESAIVANLDKIFHEFHTISYGLFRVLRNTEVIFRQVAENLVGHYESLLKERYRGHIIRVGYSSDTPEDLTAVLSRQLNLPAERMVQNRGMLRLSDLKQLVNCGREDLLFTPYVARFPERIHEFNDNYFDAIRAKEILVHHPFETFDVVVELVRQAAADPAVIAIKQTLYRTSHDSPIIKALISAAEAGKSVTCMVELKARFDEEANIRWARDLERAGAQVVFGFAELKTHAKVLMIVRKEADGLRTYVHYGTGNYHPINAKIYTDLSLLSCDKGLALDAAQLFNFMTGYSTPFSLNKISMAPLNLRQKLYDLFDNEIAHAKAGRKAAIWAKMNALVDRDIAHKIYEASQAGVKIDLVIRGPCNIRPGLKGLSDNIRVKSIVGRFLEHSRIVCFADGHGLPSEKAKVFISSADWMPRNLDRRVEVLVPIETKTVKRQVMEQIMVACIKDTAQSWQLNSDGSYARISATGQGFSAQEYFMINPSLSGRGTSGQQHLPSHITLDEEVFDA